MTTTRIRCTEAALAAAYQVLGLRASWTDGIKPDEALADSELVDSFGALTDLARTVLPVLARPSRLVSVVALSPGQDSADVASLAAPAEGGPFVFHGDREGLVELVVLDSPTAVAALLDAAMMLTRLPGIGDAQELPLSHASWWGLLAATDAVRAVRLRSQLERTREPEPVLDAALLDDQFQGAFAKDTRWLLGALAVADHRGVTAAREAVADALPSLTEAGLTVGKGESWVLSEIGRSWVELLGSFLRVSQVSVHHLAGRTPVDVGALTFVRCTRALVLARKHSRGMAITRAAPEAAVALLRDILGVPNRMLESKPVEGALWSTVEAAVETMLQAEDRTPTPSTPASGTPPQGEGKICTSCGGAIKSGAKFCTKCGAGIQASPPDSCTGCGAKLKPGVRFCTACGTRLGPSVDSQ